MEPIRIMADGLVLREWTDQDLPQMVAMFDTAEIDRWTPLAHPFDLEAAAAYVERAHAGRAGGSLQLAITEAGGPALGEILLFPAGREGTCEFAYAVGAAFRGRSLAARALDAMMPTAASAGYANAWLRIAHNNLASQRVAIRAGFVLTREPLQRRDRKGYTVELQTWARRVTHLASSPIDSA